MKRFATILLMAGLVLAFGCKKKEDPAGEKGTEKAKQAEQEKPAEKAEKPDPAVEAEKAATPSSDVAPQPEPEIAAKDVAQQPEPEAAPVDAAEQPAEQPADVVEQPAPVADVAVQPEPEAADAAAQPEPEAVDVAQDPAPADAADQPGEEGEQEESKHFGRKFKLDAVMMLSDVTKYPDHYSSFETIKLRGTIMAASEGKLLLGHETTDGIYFVCVDLADYARREIKLGDTLEFEGRLVKGSWSLDQFGEVDTKDKEQGIAEGFMLAVEAGESF